MRQLAYAALLVLALFCVPQARALPAHEECLVVAVERSGHEITIGWYPRGQAEDMVRRHNRYSEGLRYYIPRCRMSRAR